MSPMAYPNDVELVELVRGMSEIEVFKDCYGAGERKKNIRLNKGVLVPSKSRKIDGCGSNYQMYHLNHDNVVGWVRGPLKTGDEDELTVVRPSPFRDDTSTIRNETSIKVESVEANHPFEQCVTKLAELQVPFELPQVFQWGILDRENMWRRPMPIVDEGNVAQCPSSPHERETVRPGDYQVLSSAYALNLQSYPPANRLTTYQVIPSLGAKETDRLLIDKSLYVDELILPATRFSYDMLKVVLPQRMTIEDDRLTTVNIPAPSRSKAQVVILASRNGISLLDLKAMDKEWNAALRGTSIPLKLRWAELIEGGRFNLKDQIFDRFEELHEFAVEDQALRMSLGTSDIFVGLAEFLSGQTLSETDQLLFIKDNWSIRGEGLERFALALNDAPTDVSFNTISTRTVTLEKGYLEAVLSETDRGQYLESGMSDRIDALRIGEMLAVRAKAKRLNDPKYLLEEPADPKRDIYVHRAEVADYAGNLIVDTDLARLEAFFDRLQCVAGLDQQWHSNSETKDLVIASLSKIGLNEDNLVEKSLYSVIFDNFAGFTIPLATNSEQSAATAKQRVAQLAPPEIWEHSIRTVADRPGVAAYFGRLARDIAEFQETSADSCGIRFLANSRLSWPLAGTESD